MNIRDINLSNIDMEDFYRPLSVRDELVKKFALGVAKLEDRFVIGILTAYSLPSIDWESLSVDEIKAEIEKRNIQIAIRYNEPWKFILEDGKQLGPKYRVIIGRENNEIVARIDYRYFNEIDCGFFEWLLAQSQ